MGGGSKSGLSPQVENTLSANSSALTALASQQGNNANTLFQASFPGFSQAENQAAVLASGDPAAIARSIAPAAQQVSQATAGAIQNIQQSAPPGGEKNLAIEQALGGQGAQVGNLASQSYLGSFNTLAQLGGAGIGLGTQAAGTGISGYGSANQALGQLGGLQIQQKGASLGLLGGLAGDATSLAGLVPL